MNATNTKDIKSTKISVLKQYRDVFSKQEIGSTLQGVSSKAQLTDDVTRDVCFDSLAFFCMAFCSFQQVIELLRIKLLQHRKETQKSSENISNKE